MTDQFGVIRQVAYVVEDMEEALKYWVEFLGAGPFYMFEHSQMDDQKYRGGDSQVDVSLAVGNSGDVQIELIYCENDAASVYKEFWTRVGWAWMFCQNCSSKRLLICMARGRVRRASL